MIFLKNLTFSYPDSNTIFSDLALNINLAEVAILKGENGSGKTTFCRLIMGLLHNYSGSIKINDLEVNNITTEAIAEKIVYLKQEPADNIVAASALEDLNIWQYKFSNQKKEDDSIRGALDYFDLSPQSEQPVWELSSGQLKRIGLTALLLNRSKFWILDEPTAGLDKLLISRLLQLIEQQKKQKKGLLIVTHRADIFRNTADRILEIKDKRIIEI